ncbi:MAG: HEPN domain-containing protein [Patescibacteria group bacterium]|nr:HEPN domain-containing protein [Patescibacteria group bacterium]
MRENINIKKVIDYWIKGAEHNYQTAKFLYKGKRYPDCLFFCHLMIEKILKTLVVKETKTHAPYTHQLVDLAKIAKIRLTPEQIDYLTEITEFNIMARYNAYKFDFYKRCTKNYTEKYYQISKNLYLWLKKQLYQKK